MNRRTVCVFHLVCAVLTTLITPATVRAQNATIEFAPPQVVLAHDICMDLLPSGRGADVLTVHLGANRVALLANDGIGRLSPGFSSPTSASPRAGTLADVDGDGIDDLYLMSPAFDRVDLLHGTGTGFVQIGSLSAGDGPLDGIAGDFNGNGVPDLMCALHNANTFTVIEQNEIGQLKNVFSVAVPAKPFAVAKGDLNSDGIDDVALACYGASKVAVVFGSAGPLINTNVVSMPVGTRPKAVAIADFDNDGRKDIASADSATARVTVLHNVDGVSFTAMASVGVGLDPSGLGVGDFDADGDPDIAVVCGPSFAVYVLQNDGTGQFTAQTIGFNFRPGRVAIADLDQDGLPDLVVSDSQSELVHVYLNATAVSAAACPGDTNDDLRVRLDDLQFVLFDFGKSAAQRAGRGTDLNGDGLVNIADLNVLLFNFGNVCGEE